MKDEYKKVQIPFGFNNEQRRVVLPLFHTFFVAMTGHGKTLGMKSLLLRFHEQHPDWKILIIDSKDKRDFADLNSDIPICFVETVEPLDLKNLLEPIVSSNLMYYFDKIIEEAVFDTLGEIQRSIARKIEEVDAHRARMSGKELGKLRVLNYTMGKLVALVEKPNIVRDLRLHNGFNVMPVSLPDVKNPTLKRAFQQLIVRSVLILLLSDQSLEKTLLVLDESHKWDSQRYASICKQPLSEYVSEGRSQDKIVWLSDQALTKVDKEPLKNVKIWIVGQQMESNEVEDARETVNSITDLNVKDSDIKTLKVGNFILVDGLHGKVERAYLQPYCLPDKLAVTIAEGADPESAEDYIRQFEAGVVTTAEEYQKKRSAFSHEAVSKLSKKQEEDEELVYKEKFETLKKEFEDFRKTTEKEVLGLHKELTEADEKLKIAKNELEKFEKFKASWQELFGLYATATREPVKAGGLRINLEAGQTVVNIDDTETKEVNMTTDKPAGKLLYSAVQIVQSKFSDTDPTTAFFSFQELQKEAAENKWCLSNVTIGQALGYLTKEGLFIKEDDKFRLPSKVKINVTKKAD